MRNEGFSMICPGQQRPGWASPHLLRALGPLEDKAGLCGRAESAALSADWGRKAEGDRARGPEGTLLPSHPEPPVTLRWLSS